MSHDFLVQINGLLSGLKITDIRLPVMMTIYREGLKCQQKFV